jgi:hypothetical protein
MSCMGMCLWSVVVVCVCIVMDEPTGGSLGLTPCDEVRRVLTASLS